MNNRLKQIRVANNLTQQDFANKLRLASKGAISAMESGTRNITDRIVSDICREFNVNENWFRTGEEPMFLETTDIILSDLTKRYNLDELDCKMILEYAKLNTQQRSAIKHYINSVLTSDEVAATTITSAKFSPTPVTQEHPQEMDVDENLEQEANEFAEMAKRQFLSEKRRASKASFAKESDAG